MIYSLTVAVSGLIHRLSHGNTNCATDRGRSRSADHDVNRVIDRVRIAQPACHIGDNASHGGRQSTHVTRRTAAVTNRPLSDRSASGKCVLHYQPGDLSTLWNRDHLDNVTSRLSSNKRVLSRTDNHAVFDVLRRVQKEPGSRGLACRGSERSHDVSLCRSMRSGIRRADDRGKVTTIEHHLLQTSDSTSSHAELVVVVEVVFDPIKALRTRATTECHCRRLCAAESRHTSVGNSDRARDRSRNAVRRMENHAVVPTESTGINRVLSDVAALQCGLLDVEPLTRRSRDTHVSHLRVMKEHHV